MTTSTDWISDTIASLPPLVTCREAANALRCSTRTIKRLNATGRLRGVRQTETGSSRLIIPRVEIERYLRGLAVAVAS